MQIVPLLPKLRILSFQANRLTTWHSSVFDNTSIEELYVSENQLADPPAEIAHMVTAWCMYREPMWFTLKDVCRYAWQWFSRLQKNLRVLDLGKNVVKTLDHIAKCVSLTDLWVRERTITLASTHELAAVQTHTHTNIQYRYLFSLQLNDNQIDNITQIEKLKDLPHLETVSSTAMHPVIHRSDILDRTDIIRVALPGEESAQRSVWTGIPRAHNFDFAATYATRCTSHRRKYKCSRQC